MARRLRDDAPGRWHHVTNRGLAKRTMFEGERDFRMFLALVAKEVRAGQLEVHAFCLMLTHYHLLVYSPTGQLSVAMANVQREYSRWFNRSRHRDGPLVKDRFKSKVVRDMVYRCNVLTYIHDNPVAAKQVANPADYEASSAWYWARRKNRKMPKWLATDWIQRELDLRGAEQLEDVFPSRLDDDFRKMIERELGLRVPQEGEDTTIRHTLNARTVRWAFRKAKLADGTRPFRRVSPARLVEQAVALWIKQVGPLLGYFKHPLRDAWTNLKAGLLRTLSGCTQREIGLRNGRHNSSVCRDLQEHRTLLKHAPDYENLHAKIANDVIEAMRVTARKAVR
jgi:REP element-mobilizing transposase RayT